MKLESIMKVSEVHKNWNWVGQLSGPGLWQEDRNSCPK
jgi:hypothetical protein